jgi:hypothetical protein
MATFGNTNAPTLWDGQQDNGTIAGSKFTTPAGGSLTVTGVRAYPGSTSGTAPAKLVIANNDGTLVSNGVSGAQNSPSDDSAVDFTFATNPVLSAGTTYYFGLIFNATGTYVGYTADGTNQWAYQIGNTYATPTNLTLTTENGTALASMIITYTEGGGTATLTQEGYRWRLDDGDQANATWAVAQDTGITAPANTVRRLRVLIDTSGDANAALFQLEYKEANDANYTKVS